MKQKKRTAGLGVSAIALTALAAGGNTALAQVDTIIVTAAKRAENVQDVPLSIVAFDGDELEDAGVNTLQDIQFLAPGLSLPQANNVNNSRIIIRGVGSVGNSAIEPSVATFIDGVYIARPGALLGDLRDIQTVEVIRGPQGTLFGRNTTVGALNISTKNPGDEFEASMTAGYESFDTINTFGTVNIPFSDRIAGRFTGSYSRRDGFGENIRPGEQGDIGERENVTLRGKLRYDVTDSVEAVLSVDYSDLEVDGSIVEVLSSTVTPMNIANLSARTSGATPDTTDTFDYTVNQRHLDRNTTDQWGATLDVSVDVGEHTIRSISGYRDWNFDVSADPFRLPLDLITINEDFNTETFSQEFQLLSPTGGTLEYVAGLYYYFEDFTIDTDRNLDPGFCGTLVANLAPAFAPVCAAGPQNNATVAAFEQEVNSYAIFGQATLNVTDSLSLTGGLRWTSDEKTGSFVSTTTNQVVAAIQTASEPLRLLDFSDDQLTYNVSLNFRPTDGVLFYATHNTGYKSGGFNSNIGGPRPLTVEQRLFDSETVTNYEAGVKSSLIDGNLTANINLFRTRISEFQDRSFDGLGFVTTNAGALRQQGVEFDFKATPADILLLSFGGAYLDSEFLSFTNASPLPGVPGAQDLTGERAHFSPKWNLTGLAEVSDAVPGSSSLEWFARGEWAFRSDQNVGGQTNQNPQTVQEAYSITNFRVGLAGDEGAWKAVAFVENAFDVGYCQAILEQVNGGAFGVRDGAGNSLQRCILGVPRVWGVQLSVSL